MDHIDLRIRRAARHGVITIEGLRRLGLTRHAIAHRVATGRLHRLYPGVFAVGDPRLTRDGIWLAAVLAKGPRSALSHASAAVARGMARDGGLPPHVSVPGRGGLRQPNDRSYILHRPNTLPESAVALHNGIRTTTPERTLVDLAATRDQDPLLELVGEAARRRLVDLAVLDAQLTEALRGKPTSKHVCRLRNVLRRHAPELHLSESELERRFMTLCVRYRIQLPDQQVWIGRARVDFRWETERLIVETDGYETHGTIAAVSADYARQRVLTLAGWRVLRFTWADVVHHAGRTASEIGSAWAGPGRSCSETAGQGLEPR